MHSAIERLLGDLGPWVHAGRSRNDQVQTAMRLWVKDACDRLAEGVRGLALALLDVADRDGDALHARATRTASAPSRCGSASTWRRTCGRCAATWPGSPRCTRAPM